MTMTQTFEYRLREALKSAQDKISVGPKMMRALNTRVSKMMLMWKAIHDDAQHELMSRLSSKPNQCIYLYDHYLRKKMRKTCRKECIELHDSDTLAV
jgi:protein involved in temperature-dependent protein secretion